MLEANAKAAAAALGIDCQFAKVTDPMEIVNRGVVVTPALAIDGEVRVSGRVASEGELERVFTEAINATRS